MKHTANKDCAGLLIALYVIEAAVVVGAMIRYKHPADPFLTVLSGTHGPIIATAILAAVTAGAYVVRLCIRIPANDRRALWLTTWMNVASIAILVILAEGLVRVAARETARGPAVGSTVLLPYRWETTVTRNRTALQEAEVRATYFVPHPHLGWTVGPARESPDGLYAASLEGIRSAQAGAAYSGTTPGLRLAVVGDSFTFGLEVPFHDTWAYRLEEALGSGAQVLNFGVDGYGVDQAFLRFVRDVRPWRPKMIIFGFIDHDLFRSAVVYPFIAFPEWRMPFAKPRFTLRDGQLRLLNEPLPHPGALLDHGSIDDLPFITYEPGYHPHEWRWHHLHHSYLLRFLISRFPFYAEPRPEVSDEAIVALNVAILTAFAFHARESGAIPLIVYFPNRGDFRGDARTSTRAVLSSLKHRGIAHEDLTPCLSQVPAADRFVENGRHYSPKGNMAVATCLAPIVSMAVR